MYAIYTACMFSYDFSTVKLGFFICFPLSVCFGFKKKEIYLFNWYTFDSISGSSPAASYVQRSVLCSNCSANVWVFVKRVEVVESS